MTSSYDVIILIMMIMMLMASGDISEISLLCFKVKNNFMDSLAFGQEKEKDRLGDNEVVIFICR